ncbi:MAG: hypothetical protein KI785_05145 [Devosiaceae bacterium]|nr:hypothetical protein [Devosiaceae bacterium MH13]
MSVTVSEGLYLASSVLIAAPALRAAWRITSARWNARRAAQDQAAADTATGMELYRAKLSANRRKNREHDLIEFGVLLPNWAIASTVLGIGLTVAGRVLDALS